MKTIVACALLCLPAAVDAKAVPPRVELPIREVAMSDGVRRYAVVLQIDGQAVEAGLDTGSTGLRVLARALPNAHGKGAPTEYRYGAGVEFTGPSVNVGLALGALPAAEVRVARIDHVTCVERKPDCPVAGEDPAAYRIMGDGLPGQGFEAIFGIGLRHDPVDNPLVQLGIRRWIVNLPRPGDTVPGRLILNPDDAEVAHYRQFAMIDGTNLVSGCIAAVDGSGKVCAPAMLDTGSIGLRIQGGKPSDILPQSTPAAIAIGDGATIAEMHVVIGRREQMSGMRIYPARPDGKLSLSLGAGPYFHWSVLYDAPAHRMGVADRPD